MENICRDYFMLIYVVCCTISLDLGSETVYNYREPDDRWHAWINSLLSILDCGCDVELLQGPAALTSHP